MIFVTGGTGLLGSHFLFEMTRNGKRVRALKRKERDLSLLKRVFSYYSDEPGKLLDCIEWVEGDLMDFPLMDEYLEGVDEVYHAGAVVSFYPKDHKKMLTVNIEGTANLVNCALERDVKKFCYVSSVATLGSSEDDKLTDEETYWKPGSHNSIYSVSKYGAEREVWRGMEEGLNAVIVNPSVILGPGYWDDNSGLFKLVWKGLKYYTPGINGFVDVRDVARAMRLVMEQNLFNERFIVSADNVSYLQLFTLMAKYLDKPAPSVNVPRMMSNIAWRVEAVRSFLTGSLPEITREMASTTNNKYFYSNDKIKKRIGFEFIPVEESIKETCGLFIKDFLGK
ncbi:MAG: NAD-dependent epimerase/dehydratase family protein [Bacteroidota bacterium]